MNKVNLASYISKLTFDLFQRLGVHVLQNHFYSPIPDTRILGTRKDLWDNESEMAGVDLNIGGQIDYLKNVLPQYRKELNFPQNKTAIPYEYYRNNREFGFLSAAVLHSMIRHFSPGKIIEVGSGYSTMVSARACLMNETHGKTTKLTSVDPYPNKIIKKGFPGLSEVIPKKAEEVPVDFFLQLENQDILFIDSTHVIRIGGDVTYLYLDILPKLRKGVIIHIHDIFLPRHYPKDWVIQQRRFWTEQYLLQAFLTYNRNYEVMWCGSFIYLKHLSELKSAIPLPSEAHIFENYFSSSFWMRKIS